MGLELIGHVPVAGPNQAQNVNDALVDDQSGMGGKPNGHHGRPTHHGGDDTGDNKAYMGDAAQAVAPLLMVF